MNICETCIRRPVMTALLTASLICLGIFGYREHDRHDLNNIFEVVQSRVGGQVAKAGWATQAEIERFTQAAKQRPSARR